MCSNKLMPSTHKIYFSYIFSSDNGNQSYNCSKLKQKKHNTDNCWAKVYFRSVCFLSLAWFKKIKINKPFLKVVIGIFSNTFFIFNVWLKVLPLIFTVRYSGHENCCVILFVKLPLLLWLVTCRYVFICIYFFAFLNLRYNMTD